MKYLTFRSTKTNLIFYYIDKKKHTLHVEFTYIFYVIEWVEIILSTIQ